MIFTIRITDQDALALQALLEMGMEVIQGSAAELGKESELALDRFFVQTGRNPVWHSPNDELLRPKGE